MTLRAEFDIFRGNALNNGLLPIQLKDEELDLVFQAIEANPQQTFAVNLPEQYLKIEGTDHQFSFDIDPYKKTCLLNGYDDIDYLLSIKDKITAFEAKRPAFL